jgi:hypothetical protein
MTVQNHIKSIFFEKNKPFFQKMYIFAPTVPVLHTVRSASGSFSKDSLITQDNTPPMPLYDAHLGGFLIL